LTRAPSDAPTDRRPFAVGAALFVAAALIRFYHLDGQSLWNDEMFSIDLARSSLPDLLRKLISYYHHPPLFFVILHILFRAFGDSVWVLRCVSALAGSLTVVAVYILGRRVSNNFAAVAAAILCLVSPFHLAYSQEGRPYALAALLALLVFFLMIEYLDSAKRRWIVLYVLGSIALLYTHYWGLFVIAGHIVFILFFQDSPKRPFLIAWLLTGLAFVPQLPVLFEQSSPQHAGGWWWVESPGPREILNVIGAYGGSSFKMASAVFQQPFGVQLIGIITASLLIFNVLVMIIRKQSNGNVEALFICLSLSLLIPFGLSFYRSEVFIWYRYTVILYPLFCVLIGCSASRWKKDAARQFMVSILVIIGAVGTVKYFSWSKSNVRDVAVYTDLVTRDSVKLIIRPPAFAPLLSYYYHGDARQVDETYLDQPLGAIVDTARSFVYISLDVPNEIRAYMDGHFSKIEERKFPGEAHMGMVVGVYAQKPEEKSN